MLELIEHETETMMIENPAPYAEIRSICGLHSRVDISLSAAAPIHSPTRLRFLRAHASGLRDVKSASHRRGADHPQHTPRVLPRCHAHWCENHMRDLCLLKCANTHPHTHKGHRDIIIIRISRESHTWARVESWSMQSRAPKPNRVKLVDEYSIRYIDI